ncbi:zinc-dependent metalloprotease [Simiduia curdlanivorans]|uniref:Zinc-dependent metalloprotease n=1 Tax=Simiduia curdlanivorans TaxID=1492769 RepID=A0ABV8V551_9GAMM|nr:zinc-dependent metalloprotease [Simiduia curdlanivorans]MDN3638327.1 zinc-dependent metalloprotease [Simiduia curdlanivorans]
MKTRLIALALSFCGLLLGCNQAPAPSHEIASFTQNMQAQAGLIPIYYAPDTGKVYLEVAKTSPEYIYYFSLPQGLGSNDIGLDRGQLMDLNTKLVRFETVGDKVLLRQLNTYYRADSSNALEQQSVQEAFASSVLWGFPVVARNDSHVLVDATEFALRDSHGVARRLKQTKQGDFRLDSSRSAIYLPRTKAFPTNTEIEATVSFTGEEPGQFVQDVSPDAYAISLRMHHSFVALPDAGYTPRPFHPQSGFWSFEYKDYAAAIEEDMTKRFIPRHRLTKKDPSAELSEAVKPIIYYLDPGTPEPVRTALLDGGRWWNQAFEAAGYKDAFQIKILPEDADPLDARYNVIQWVHRATRGWSYGYGLTDPRTGEIIKGHVTLGSLRVRQDYLIAQGMTAPFTTDNADTQAQSAMALARIRQLSAHEIGHTLGIAHNFAASNKDRASVMDYPHPLFELTGENKITLSNAYAENIGAWDKRVIQYGYGDFADQQARLDFIDQSRAQGFTFISDPDSRSASDTHASSSLWDNGADAVAELSKVIALRKVALENFNQNALAPNRPFSDLEEILVPIYFFHRYQAEAAGKWIGGLEYNYGVKGDAANLVHEPIAAARQLKAIDALLGTLEPAFLQLPKTIEALIPPKAYGYSKTRESTQGYTGTVLDPVSMAEASVNHSLDILIAPERLARLNWQHIDMQTLPNAEKLMAQVWQRLSEKSNSAPIIQERAQTAYVNKIGALLVAKAAPEVKAAALKTLNKIVKDSDLKGANETTQGQWLSALARQKIGKLTTDGDDAGKMPPGSPI